MRIFIVAVLVFSCGFCLAEDFPEDTNEIKSLTAEQAADLALIVKHARKKIPYTCLTWLQSTKTLLMSWRNLKGSWPLV